MTYYRDIVLMPEQEIALLRSLPNWPARTAIAHTVPRELRAFDSYVFDTTRFEDLKTPTLLLLGGDSPASEQVATELVHSALPQSCIVTLPGQRHAAMLTAPDLFAREVVRWAIQ